MSLETKIEKLTEAVTTLTETILKSDIGALLKEQAGEIDKAVGETTKAAKAKKQDAPKAKSQDAPKAKSQDEPKAEKPEQTNDDTPTVDEIKSLCMTLVRADKTKKQPILDALGEYGAKTVDKVPANKLGELKAKLEAL